MATAAARTSPAAALSISSDGNLGTGGTVALGDGTGIDFTAGGTYSHDITVAGDPTFTVGTGLTVTQSGQIADGATPGDVEVKGGGTLVLSNAANSYSGGTTVSEGSTLSIAASGALGAGGLTLGDATTGGTLALTATLSSARGITLGAGGGSVDVADRNDGDALRRGLRGWRADRGGVTNRASRARSRARAADQDRHRHADSRRHQPLHRRHERDRRHPLDLLGRQSGQWRDGEPGRGHHPLLHSPAAPTPTTSR